MTKLTLHSWIPSRPYPSVRPPRPAPSRPTPTCHPAKGKVVLTGGGRVEVSEWTFCSLCVTSGPRRCPRWWLSATRHHGDPRKSSLGRECGETSTRRLYPVWALVTVPVTHRDLDLTLISVVTGSPPRPQPETPEESRTDGRITYFLGHVVSWGTGVPSGVNTPSTTPKRSQSWGQHWLWMSWTS